MNKIVAIAANFDLMMFRFQDLVKIWSSRLLNFKIIVGLEWEMFNQSPSFSPVIVISSVFKVVVSNKIVRIAKNLDSMMF